MAAVDQKGKLYLGNEYDLPTGTVTGKRLFYKARHLTTHGIILGMTGSGKTGLGIILLEEALLQGVPVLVLDPKGDISNLMLNFSGFSAEEFQPWVDPEGARRRGVTLAEFAAQEAEKWRKGLADSGITGERLTRLRESAMFTIYTPGSTAGQPVDVLHFFDAPDGEWDDYEETLRERIAGIVSALLGLVGIESDPLQSPEHILLARIIEHAWRGGESIDLPVLIQSLQHPPFRRVGVFDLEAFFPKKKRMELARTLNNLVAAPGFETWREGAPLDIASLLRAPDGRPQASIFYLAHLNDAQRMFFVTMFMEAARDWLRMQSGTTDLRALVYFDEVFGYFPPYPANPPSKTPLMAIIKQGRSAGLGMVLSTQNPADLDYKGLTNAGTWAIGALRSERDKMRVMEGLEGALAEAGESMDQRTVDQALGSLESRVFLFHDIHEGAPLFFHTRWAMSYLRGPLTRKQIRQLAADQTGPVPSVVRASQTREADAGAELPPDLSRTPSSLPSDVRQVFLPPTVTFEVAVHQYQEANRQPVEVADKQMVYVPHLLAMAGVRLVDQKRDVNQLVKVVRLQGMDERDVFVDWSEGSAPVDEDELLPGPAGEGYYAPVPPTISSARALKKLRQEFSDYVYYNTSVSIFENATLKVYGEVGESKGGFLSRCEQATRKMLEADIDKARKAFAKKIDRVEDRLRREKRELSEDEMQLAARRRDEVLTLGESALRLLGGRRSVTSLSRSSTKRRMTQQAKADVEESEDEIEDLGKDLADLKEQWTQEAAEIHSRWAEKLEDVTTRQIKPRRTDVVVQFCGLAWTPIWRVVSNDGSVIELPAREMGPQV